MKKVLMTLLCGVLCSMTISAQNLLKTPFYEGKFYVGASTTGVGLNYSSSEKWNMDLSLRGGYLVEDNWMVTGQMGFDYHEAAPNAFNAGIGVRYYIQDNGLFMGLGANYVHANHNYDDVMPMINVGYAFFLNRHVTLEPELFYKQSLHSHSDYSGFGARIGLGIYFE